MYRINPASPAAAKRRLTALLLALLMILSAGAACVSCGGGTPDETEPVATLPLTADGAFIYKAIRSEKSSAALTSAFAAFGTEIRTSLDVKLEMGTDWLRELPEGGVDTDDFEMLIGATNRVESKAAAEEIKGDSDYMICLTGNKLVILGGTDNATVKALEYFRSYLLGSGGVIPEGYSYRFSLMAEGGVLDRLTTEYGIIRSEKAGEREVLSAANLKKSLDGLAGKSDETDTGIGIRTDWDISLQKGETVDNGEREIIVGETNRVESVETAARVSSCMDYIIRITGTKVIICGGCGFSSQRGVDKFIELVCDGVITSLDTEYEYYEDFEALYPVNPLIYDASGFVPVWSGSFSVPDWCGDMREKVRALTGGSSVRLTSIAHRGDVIYYPENSVEGYLSACLAGADSVEVDVRLSADNVPVMMHDDTLKRTTDWSAKNGRDGLPTSAKIEDWTYAQLLRLNLKLTDGTVTEYKIPTFYETIAILGGRSFIRVDDKLGMLDLEDDMFPMGYETDSLDTFLCRYGIGNLVKWAKLEGVSEEFREFTAYASSYLSGKTMRGSYWPSDENSYQNMVETPAYWEQMRTAGKCNIWSDKIVGFCQYIYAHDKAAD